VAMLTSGIHDPPEAYEVDLFGPHAQELYDGDKLLALKACLMQVIDLRNFWETKSPPRGFIEHLREAEAHAFGLGDDELADLHWRYAAEWQPLIASAKHQGLRWASWVKRVAA
jgi:hypothetical protein